MNITEQGVDIGMGMGNGDCHDTYSRKPRDKLLVSKDGTGFRGWEVIENPWIEQRELCLTTYFMMSKTKTRKARRRSFYSKQCDDLHWNPVKNGKRRMKNRHSSPYRSLAVKI